MILKLWGVSFYFSKVEFFCFIKKHILHLKNPQFTFYTKKNPQFSQAFFSPPKKNCKIKINTKKTHCYCCAKISNTVKKKKRILSTGHLGTEVHI
jgi:hypothetical protein